MEREGIVVERLSFSYPGYPGLPARPLLEGLNLRVGSGEAFLLLGASDEGKTTLARILGGLVPRFTGGAIAGTVRVGDADARRSAPYDLLERVGLVFQHPDEQIVGTRCDAEIAFALESLGIDRGVMARTVRDALDRFGLEGFASRNPASLSGGEKKRLMLACLAAADPAVWVLDEAFEELDLSWRLATLEHLRGKGRTALLLDSRWAAGYAGRVDRLAVLAGGSVRCVAADAASPRIAAAMEEAGILPPPRAAAPTRGATPARGATRPAASATLVRVRDVRFAFPVPGSFSLEVDALDLSRGEVTALVGPNGSGKSTLARLLCGLLEPARGDIEIARGDGFVRASAADLNRRVGYAFQDPDHQIFLPTVRDELAVSLRATGAKGTAVEPMIAQTIERFGLPPAVTPPALMSYGARKILQAAVCWLLGRELVILDEADAGLSYRRFLALLTELRSGGAGVLLVTHDAALARTAAGRVLVMRAGRLVADAGPDGLEAALAAGGLIVPEGGP